MKTRSLSVKLAPHPGITPKIHLHARNHRASKRSTCVADYRHIGQGFWEGAKTFHPAISIKTLVLENRQVCSRNRKSHPVMTPEIHSQVRNQLVSAASSSWVRWMTFTGYGGEVPQSSGASSRDYAATGGSQKASHDKFLVLGWFDGGCPPRHRRHG